MKTIKRLALLSGAVPLFVTVNGVQAQNTPTAAEVGGKLQKLGARVQKIANEPMEEVFLGSAPGLSANVPNAYGAPYGVGGVGASYQYRTRFSNKHDSALGASVGLNNTTSPTGAQLGVSLLDVSNAGNRGSFNFKVFHRLKPGTNVAVGVDNVFSWPNNAPGKGIVSDVPVTTYAVLSHQLKLSESNRPFSKLSLGVGVGNGRFRKLSDVAAGKSSVNFFGSIGTKIMRKTNAFAEWSGQDLNVGVSLAPFKKPVVLTVALVDCLDKAGAFAPPGAVKSAGPRLTLGLGYRLNWTP